MAAHQRNLTDHLIPSQECEWNPAAGLLDLAYHLHVRRLGRSSDQELIRTRNPLAIGSEHSQAHVAGSHELVPHRLQTFDNLLDVVPRSFHGLARDGASVGHDRALQFDPNATILLAMDFLSKPHAAAPGI